MPLWPLPDVLPVPEPGPRPRRLRSRCDPGAGTRLCSPIFPPCGSPAVPSSCFATDLFLRRGDRHQMPDLLQHPAKGRRVLLDDDILMVLEADRLERLLHAPRVTDAAADLLDPQLARPRRNLLRGVGRTLGAVKYECSRHVLPLSTSHAKCNRCSTPRFRARGRSA